MRLNVAVQKNVEAVFFKIGFFFSFLSNWIFFDWILVHSAAKVKRDQSFQLVFK